MFLFLDEFNDVNQKTIVDKLLKLIIVKSIQKRVLEALMNMK